MSEPKRVKVSEAARILGISIDAVQKLCQAGKIPAKKDERGRWMLETKAVRERVQVKADGQEAETD